MGLSAVAVLVFLMVTGALGSLYWLLFGTLSKGYSRVSVAKGGHVGDGHQAPPTGRSEQYEKIAAVAKPVPSYLPVLERLAGTTFGYSNHANYI